MNQKKITKRQDRSFCFMLQAGNAGNYKRKLQTAVIMILFKIKKRQWDLQIRDSSHVDVYSAST
jgi:hypothetical protein